jgi:amino acid adenylation domain-containing protein
MTRLDTASHAFVLADPAERDGAVRPHEDHALSSQQLRMWLLERLYGAGRAYNVPQSLRLRGELDRPTLQAAVERAIARHDVLRTTFLEVDGRPVQRVRRCVPGANTFVLRDHDLTGMAEQDAELRRLIADEADAPFDLERGPLIRGRLVRLGANDWVLLLTMHHIVSDAQSFRVLVREVGVAYAALQRGEAPLPPLATQYAEYAAWQQATIAQGAVAEQEDYWRKVLAGAPELLALPTDFRRPATQTFDGDHLEVELDEHLTAGLRALSWRRRVTPFTTVLAAWGLVLSRLSGQADVVVGITTANRRRREDGELIGFFANTLPVRLDFSGWPTLRELMLRAMTRASEAQLNDDVPFERIVTLSGNARSTGHAPLVQAMFTWLGEPDFTLELPGVASAPAVRSPQRTSRLDLTLRLEQRGNRITGGIEYATSLFERATVARFAESLRRVLEEMVAADDQRADLVDLVSAAERAQLVDTWNATDDAAPRDVLVHEWFERQVDQAPHAVAVVFHDEQLSYAELNARANRWAHRLRTLGVGPDVRVALCLGRSVELVIGALAVLKAGGAYVPLDPEYPTERLRYLLADSAPAVVLTVRALAGLVEGDAPLLLLDDEDRAPAGRPELDPARLGRTAEHLAYVIYTSGSTGKPKGVMVAHRALANHLSWRQRLAPLDTGDALLQKIAVGFDVSVGEMFWPLLAGARLVVAPPGAQRDPDYLAETIDRERITTAVILPPQLRPVLEHPAIDVRSTLRHVVTGGEALPDAAARAVLERLPRVSLYHEYGLTETTVTSTGYFYPRDGETSGAGAAGSIGRPVTNTRAYVLDAVGALVSVGVVGELWIGGAGVARGYHGRAALTAERFVPDPFGGEPGARLYRTGDLVRWRRDGTLEFLGRSDFQVKIRGFRVELGEIEAQLQEHAAVREAVVVARADAAGELRLVAYWTGEAECGPDELRSALAARLPEHMVPAAYVRLAELPRAPNGKVDRAALPPPGDDAFLHRAYEAPVGETEETLAGIWAEVLGLERVGRRDHFFELGGSSLLVVRAAGQMSRRGLHADAQAYFTAPVLAELAARVEGGRRDVAVPPKGIPAAGCDAIRPDMLPLVSLSAAEIDAVVRTVAGGAANVQDIYPLAPLQEGILFHHLLTTRGDPYVLSVLLRFGDRARLDAYVAALQAVVARHDILRTGVVWEGLREPVQVVWRYATLAVEDVALDAADGDVGEQLWARHDARRHRMDMRRAPLIRMWAAWDAASGQWVLLQQQHQFIGDHMTMDELDAEVIAHLEGRAAELSPPMPFRTYIAQTRSAPRKAAHEAYFRALLADVSEPTAPFGLLDVWGDGSGSEVARSELPGGLAARLRAEARRLGVSVAALCHVAWAQVLARAAARQDVVFGTVLFGRLGGGEGADRVLGPFINTLPVRVRVDAGGVRAAVRDMHAQLAELLAHEHASLAVAQRASGVPAPAPLFTSLLNYRHNPAAKAMRDGATLRGVRRQEWTNYPLLMSVDDLGDGLRLTADMHASVGAARMCAMMERALETLVDAVEHAPERALDALDVLSASERELVVETWNATAAPFPSDACLHELIEAQAARTPDAVAVEFEDEQLSYAVLEARASQLARELRTLGVGPDTRVALCLERSAELIVALFGVLKAGGAYVPLDPSHPAERLAYMLADSAPVVVLTQAALAGRFADVAVPVHVLDGAPPSPRTDEAALTPGALTPAHLAYMIYTSGSTGRPKGTMVSHQGVVNLLWAMRGAAEVGPADVVLALTTVAFDIAALELFLPLLCGARVAIADRRTAGDPAALQEALRDRRATLLQATPATWRLLVAHGWPGDPSLRALCGGEALPVELAAELGARVGALWNVYGPTETTIWSAAARVFAPGRASDPSVAIGRPLANTQVYVQEAQGVVAPVGVRGELYIGGAGVARGYFGRPGLTAERFVPDPYGPPGSRLYRTGDLGRWRGDGALEYLGRTDFQVKVRGFRIELGEIEARLGSHAGIAACAVVLHGVGGETRLVAYYVAAEPLAVGELRAHLSATLPEYMVPAAYVRLDALPLTPNGKVDRKALPAPEGDAYARRGYEAPVGETEEALAAIWAEVLGVEQVGRHDHFFELGGHSLLVVRAAERMRQRGLHAEPQAFFTAPVLAELAAQADGARPEAPVPPNGIPAAGCDAIRPDMLPLVTLSESEIEEVVRTVEGGAANVQDIYPLAPLQEGILFHHLLAQDGDPYLLARVRSFPDRQQLDAYVEALQAAVRRHDILRTAMAWEGLREPVQVVWRHAPVVVDEVTLDAGAGDVGEQLWERYNPRHHRLDVRRAPLLRLWTAWDAAQGAWVALLHFHHLIGDQVSLEVLEAELAAHLEERAADELPPALPFRNYVARTRSGVGRDAHEAYFRNLLGDVDEPTAPFGLLDVLGDGRGIQEARRELPDELAARVRAEARRLGVSAASLCHVAWGQVLARATGREHVVFGTVLFGRFRGGEGSDRVMGPFIDTLPVRVRVGAQAAREAVRAMHAQLAELLRHEHASLALAQRCSAVAAPAPLFTTLLNYRHGHVAAPGREPGALRAFRAEVRSNYPITLSVDDLGSGLRMTAKAPGSVGAARVYALMERALTGLVDALEHAPESALGTLEVLPAAERAQVVDEWNATAVPDRGDALVHDLFEQQVDRTPDAVALVFEAEAVSYQALNGRANRMARHLRGLGVGPDVRVALCVERSVEMVVAVLAVLKAGGAYVPLDPGYPEERLHMMLADSQPAVVLTQRALRGRFAAERPVIVVDDDDDAPWRHEPATNLGRGALTPEHLTHVGYTSGSTGRPKGVENVRRATANRMAWMRARWGVGPGDVVLQNSSISFDASLIEILLPLTTGGRLVLPRPGAAVQALDALVATVCRERVTTAYFVCSLLQLFVEADAAPACTALTRVLCGGEPLSGALVRRFYERLPGARLHNLYGPSELAVTATTPVAVPEPGAEPRVAIGRPTPNTRVYVLDGRGSPVPVGVVGELWVGGVQMARGYHGQRSRTAEQFLPDPFGEPGGRLYRTGDLARWHADGALEFLGRSDFQVKVRGYRIEPGEVEARLLEHAAVRRCVVVAREGSQGDQRLVAYWVAEDGSADVRVEALRTHLLERLPEYMVPAAFVRVDAMPQTPSGKLDRKALPAPDSDAFARGAYEAPAGETETTLAEIWAEVLGVARVGRRDHFFELGGHSLIAIRLIERMRQRGLRAEVRAVFTSPTLSDLASHCQALHEDVEVPANGIPDACAAITPEMVTLVDLTQDEIDWIVGEVEGGAANVQDIYPLAPLQEGILFHHMMATDGDPYVTPVVLGFERRDRLDAFLAAWQGVIDRHDILRTAVLWERVRTPVQVVWRRARLSVTEVELSASGGDAVAQLWEHCDPRRARMDVQRAPLVDAHVAYDAPNDRWLLLQRRHHLVSDHTTQDMVRSETAAFLLGRAAELPPPVPFRSHVARAKLSARANDDEAYFRHLLGDVTQPTAPFDLLEVMGDGSGVDEASFRLETELADRLQERARVLGLGVATLCHVAWAQVLARVTGRDDVVFGTVLFGRMRGADGLAGALGPFINTLPVRVALGDVGVEQCVRDVHAQLGALLRHEHASLGLAQRASGVPAPAPLFTSLLNYRYLHQDGGGASWSREGIDGIQSIRGRERTNYPIGLAVNALPDGHSLTAQVPLSIGAHRVCALMRSALEALADALETAPQRAIGTLDVLPDAERRQVVEAWNATDAEYSRESALVHELFERQVGLTPAAVAVAFEDEQVSYAELDRRANGLAHHLRGLGVGPDVRVAVCLERSPELVVAVLGVLKAGGVYVPIDPEYPTERLRYLLTDSAPAVVLTQRRLAGRLPGGVPVVDVDAPVWAGAGAATPPARGALAPGHLAYVLYTSGSTGEPKGVMVAHGALVNQLSWRQEVARHGPGDAVLQRISVGFDVSLCEMFWPLVGGARLIVARPGGQREPAYLADVLCRERVSTAVLLPAEMRDVLEAPAIGAGCSVRLLISGGEALGDDLARDARARLSDAALLFEYGLTETTVTSTVQLCTAVGAVPGGSIGQPVANTRVYVLDGRGEPAPVGVGGELYVGGAQVARGYRGRPGLTAERFVPDPYGPPGSRLYRTGDVARWRADATLEYLGRADFQVKVRGFRVELGEIEARLRTHAGVRDAAVAVWGAGTSARLVAYYASAEAIEVEALREYLSDALPEHMVPAAYVRLDALPLTVNGKVDRKALPAPTADAHLQRRYEAPASDVEAALAAIWSELLRVDRVGRHDHFFALGGHSLLVVQLTSRLRQVLGVEVAVGVVFSHPVLADLARAVERARRSELPPIDRLERRDRVPASFAQQRLWFLERLGGLGNAYHIAGRMRLLGPLDATALRRALDGLVARHEPLRTTFVLVGDAPEQRIAAPETSRFALAEHDLRECAGGEAARDAELGRLIAAEADTPFDLERGPLVRAQLVRLADAEHVLLVTMHHIVSDGWSMGVFLRELKALYAAFQRGESDPLPPLTIQYADYAAWQRRWVTGDLLQRQASYWQETLAGAPELLELPTDRPRPAQREPAAAAVPVVLDAELTAALKELSRRQGTTLFVTLLAGWAAVLGRLSGQRDVVIGTPTANRSHAELEPLIGFFVNTLALRVDLTKDPTVAELVRRVKTRAIEAQEHQDIPFEHVVERVRPVRSLAHTPVTQVVFAWQQEPVTELELAGVRLGASPARASGTSGSSAPTRDTNFDLSLGLVETGGEIRGDVKFATALFERATLERHVGYLRRMLEHMVADVHQRVAALPLLADAERQRVVERWNATDSAYEQDALAHELFERHADLTPAAVAVVFGDEQVSYAELNERAARLAHYLRVVHGVGPESRVALCVGRSVELIVAILGVLKAGGAYVPLDPGYPAARLEFMLDDSAPVVILTAGDTGAEALGARSAVPVVDLGRDAPVWASPPMLGPSAPLTAAHPAYVIYTSGSTGRPKGVVVTHGGVRNLVAAQTRSLRVGPRSRVLQFASSSFDASVFEWVMALCQGAALHVPNAGGQLTGDVVREAIERAELTHVTLPPSLLATLPVAATLASVETMVVAGEALPAALVARWARGRRMLNAYGPTETTVWATRHECRADAGGAPPIGAPIANTRVYVLDECGEPAPIGVRGELYVGGAQLARGYRGRPGLTAERFVPDPYGPPGSRLYRTGDVARWRGDGALEYLGRADFQVKVRGFRIELGEIEARLEAHTGVREAVVAARAGATGDVQLVAYYVESPNAKVRASGAEVLRANLRETLPEYMVPAAYVRLNALPLTPNGKVDRNALPAPDGDAFARHGYEPPVGAVEHALAEVWAEVLGVERVGRHDHFFELGGHSLLAVTLIEGLRRRGMRLEVRALFATPTLAELAATVGGDARELPVPPNRIPADCERITPELLPLAELTQREIDEIVAKVPGGAANVQDVYPLAPLQEGILFHHLMAQEGDPYILAVLRDFPDRAALDAYLAALQAVVARHDILRTAMAWEGLREPVQVVWRHAPVVVEEVTLDAGAGAAGEQLWARYNPRHLRLDVRRAPLLRLWAAWDAAQGAWVTLLHFHHLIGDHVTLDVLETELAAHLEGRADELPPALPFRTYVARARQSADRDEHEAYFRQLLGDVVEPTAPFGLLDAWGDGSEVEEARLALPPELSRGLRARARALGVTAASLCHVAWAQVIARATARRDVVFGTVLFGRTAAGEGGDRVPGPFINTLPMRIDVGAAGAEASVHAAHAQLGELLRHEHASLALAQRASGVPAPAPLFTALLNYRFGRAAASPSTGVASSSASRARTRNNYPVTLNVSDLGDELRLTALVAASVGAARVCALMQTALASLVAALEEAPETPLTELEVLPAAERALLLDEWNATDAQYPDGVCLHELVEQQAARTPDAVALVFGDAQVSYAELDRRATRLAEELRAAGVGPDVRVGVCLERSLELLVALLGVLKAGGAYVPLDPSYPEERLRHLVADSAPAVVLLQPGRATPWAAAETGPRVIVLEDRPSERGERAPATAPAPRLATGLTAEHLAYVLYTSGSTGRPKGVRVSHRNVVNVLRWMRALWQVDGEEIYLQKTPYNFDASLRELLLPLVGGARLVVARPEGHREAGYLVELIARERVTTLHFVPSLLEVLLREAELGRCAGVRRVVCGGEALPPALARRFAETLPGARLWNVYGPTEAAVDVTALEVRAPDAGSAGKAIPLGAPMANTRAYVLDDALDPVPVGVAGELYLGGAQVAQGYHGQPGLTADRFVADPFAREPGGRLYHTGDLARWRSDGTLEYLGRADHQVKVRGFRIELGEIEAQLREHAGVREAVVLAREDEPGETRLVAYWVRAAATGAEASAEALRAALAERLPEHMVPAAFVELEHFPLMPNGKLDRKALPSPELAGDGPQQYEAPDGETETALAELWMQVLGVERVSRSDNFAALGGHSLRAIMLVGRIKRRMGTGIPLQEVFKSPTLADMARCILMKRLAQFDPETLARLEREL